jgi:hypothetical protein
MQMPDAMDFVKCVEERGQIANMNARPRQRLAGLFGAQDMDVTSRSGENFLVPPKRSLAGHHAPQWLSRSGNCQAHLIVLQRSASDDNGIGFLPKFDQTIMIPR